uniref:Uncharacterized protein n=1 Tax=Cyanoderma ruficeps TaxID=181631 RepID=A0A8C3QVT6_9PASS
MEKRGSGIAGRQGSERRLHFQRAWKHLGNFGAFPNRFTGLPGEGAGSRDGEYPGNILVPVLLQREPGWGISREYPGIILVPVLLQREPGSGISREYPGARAAAAGAGMGNIPGISQEYPGNIPVLVLLERNLGSGWGTENQLRSGTPRKSPDPENLPTQKIC